MSEFIYVLVYLFLVHNGLEQGVVNPEGFTTNEACETAYANLEGLSPHDIARIDSGEVVLSAACLKVARQ